jgi:hypothetical protein
MHECLVIKTVLKQHVLDNANGACSQSVARGLVWGQVVDDNVPVLGSVFELRVVALDFPQPAEQKEHFFHVSDD